MIICQLGLVAHLPASKARDGFADTINRVAFGKERRELLWPKRKEKGKELIVLVVKIGDGKTSTAGHSHHSRPSSKKHNGTRNMSRGGSARMSRESCLLVTAGMRVPLRMMNSLVRVTKMTTPRL
jgi:hypothetical protein